MSHGRDAGLHGDIGNTDHDWFDFLSSTHQGKEVNWWSPSGYYTYRGRLGSPFFFRLKSPRNAIGGFGLVRWAEALPEWLAWECFEQGNGAANYKEFQRRLSSLRASNKIKSPGADAKIGCTILTESVFFPRELWIPQPSDWGSQNMRYKGYDLSVGEGQRIWLECLARTQTVRPDHPVTRSTSEPGPRFGKPALILPRLGQGTFRLAVTDAYKRACAITGEHSLPVLEACHIRPYGEGGEHATSNGILLRSDLHRLFDRGYLTVTPDHRVEVSSRLRTDYENGKTYYPLHGTVLQVPTSNDDLPSNEHLDWHNKNRFRAA